LIAAGRGDDLPNAVKIGAGAIDSGAASEVLRRLVEFTKSGCVQVPK
jgi:anthranilate phosphoribosyltransferase